MIGYDVNDKCKKRSKHASEATLGAVLWSLCFRDYTVST
jgi:hypothetical protein